LICHDFAPASGFGRIQPQPRHDERLVLARRDVIFYYITILPLLATLVQAMVEASNGRMGQAKAEPDQ
jgi:hypothetical protein